MYVQMSTYRIGQRRRLRQPKREEEEEAAESGGSRSDRSKQDFNDPEEGSSYSDSIPTLETTHTVLYPWTPILLTTALRMCSVRIDSGRDAMRWYGMVWYGKR